MNYMNNKLKRKPGFDGLLLTGVTELKHRELAMEM